MEMNQGVASKLVYIVLGFAQCNHTSTTISSDTILQYKHFGHFSTEIYPVKNTSINYGHQNQHHALHRRHT